MAYSITADISGSPLAENPPTQNKRLVSSLQTQIIEMLKRLIPAGAKVAHVGYPDHWNTGDQAIWLGTEAALEHLGVEVVYQCNHASYQKDVMSKLVGNGPILIAGGGNLGDVWPNEQRLREKVLHDFPQNPVLQLPQSLWFEHDENLHRFQDICSRHQNFHLVVRDNQSLTMAEDMLSAHVHFWPDLAFGLGNIERPYQPSQEIVWLSRSDRESAGYPEQAVDLDVEFLDWVDSETVDQFYSVRAAKHQQRIKEFQHQLSGNSGNLSKCSSLIAAHYRSLARLRVRRGLEMLSTGKVVISDRLHAHILCLLMGIPHVVLDNSYKKVSSFFKSWTSTSPIARWAASPEAALREAKLLAAGITDVPDRNWRRAESGIADTWNAR